MTQMIKPSRVLHVGVLMTKEPTGVIDLLRDTNNKVIVDTGWGALSAPNLQSGITMTPRTFT